jgi:hypothetical protein
MSYNPIVVTLASLNPFFFNGFNKELGFANNAWSIRPRNPIRAIRDYYEKKRVLLEQRESLSAMFFHRVPPCPAPGGGSATTIAPLAPPHRARRGALA